jgi:hypothetical protein
LPKLLNHNDLQIMSKELAVDFQPYLEMIQFATKQWAQKIAAAADINANQKAELCSHGMVIEFTPKHPGQRCTAIERLDIDAEFE